MDTAKRMKNCRIKKGISADELAEKIGVSRSTIFRYESGAIEKMPLSILEPIAQALGTTPAYLMGWTDNDSNAEMMNDPWGVQKARDFAATMKDFITTSNNLEPMPNTRQLPLLGTIACGEPVLALENIEAYITVPDGVHADFVLRCKGDSMINARIHDGDVVFIREQPEVENGEIAAVLNGDGEATLKRVYYDGNSIILQPENPAYAPRSYVGPELDGVRIIGKAVAFLSEIK